MKLYRSLVYRELRLTRRRCILMLVLFVLLALLMLTPAFLGAFSEPMGSEDDPLGITLVFTGLAALIGAFLAGTNNGLQKADISSGWKRYSFVLPPNARQQALSDLMAKIIYILLFGAASVVYAMIYGSITNISVVSHIINIFLGTVSAIMLIDAAYSYIVMFAKNKKELGMFGVIAFFGAGLILRAVSFFTDIVKTPERPAEGEALISEEAFNSFLNTLGSGKTALYVSAAFVVVCVFYFLVMWRSHERREP